MNTLASIPDAIEEIKKGHMLVVVDSPGRENQGDIIFSAEYVDVEKIQFLLKECRGLICVAMTKEQTMKFDLPLMVKPINANEKTGVQFTVSIDAKDVTSFGISSSDRAMTIKKLADPDSSSSDFVRPGHIFPLLARDGGVLERQGHTESAVDLCKLASLLPVGVLCEILGEDGEPATGSTLLDFAQKHNIAMVSVEDLYEYLKSNPINVDTHSSIFRTANAKLPTKYGEFDIFVYKSIIDDCEHVALVLGDIKNPMLTRVHSECITGDTLGSTKCDCGEQLQKSMELISRKGSGIILYLNQEGRGIGLTNKIKAYALQQAEGLDTVEANLALGFEPDERDFKIAVEILNELGVTDVVLLTNNPNKADSLERSGIRIVEQIPLEISPSKNNIQYLSTKKEKLGHNLHLV